MEKLKRFLAALKRFLTKRRSIRYTKIYWYIWQIKSDWDRRRPKLVPVHTPGPAQSGFNPLRCPVCGSTAAHYPAGNIEKDGSQRKRFKCGESDHHFVV